MKISSRFQPLTATTSRYHFQLPTSEQNRRYSNMKLKPSEAQGPASIESTASQRPERPESDESRPPTRPTPMLTKLRMPVKEGLTRLRPGVAYSISRLEEWFLLLDTNRSGEVTVRKLILGMMKHQAPRVSEDRQGFVAICESSKGDHGPRLLTEGEVGRPLVAAPAGG